MDLLTIVANYNLTGMILQVHVPNFTLPNKCQTLEDVFFNGLPKMVHSWNSEQAYFIGYWLFQLDDVSQIHGEIVRNNHIHPSKMVVYWQRFSWMMGIPNLYLHVSHGGWNRETSIHPFFQWLFLVPLKGGIGGIFHPPIGRKYTTYIPLIVIAFWGMKNATDPTF